MVFERGKSCLLVAALFLIGCASEVSQDDARQKADEYIKTEFSVDDTRQLNVEMAQQPKQWVVTYSGEGDTLGGPLIIGVDRTTGRAHLIGGGQ